MHKKLPYHRCNLDTYRTSKIIKLQLLFSSALPSTSRALFDIQRFHMIHHETPDPTKLQTSSSKHDYLCIPLQYAKLHLSHPTRPQEMKILRLPTQLFHTPGRIWETWWRSLNQSPRTTSMGWKWKWQFALVPLTIGIGVCSTNYPLRLWGSSNWQFVLHTPKIHSP